MSFPYLPAEDSITSPYWSATKESRLLLQWCRGCEQYQFYPRALCSHCGQIDLEWQQVSGRGIIDSWTQVMRAPQEGFEVPYFIARIRLAEGPIMLSRVVSEKKPSCDQEVEVTWQDLSDGRRLPLFVLVGG